ncbi:MAG: hypothetical protein R2755_08945 [Acidimicrobiales bacterium]
MLEALDYQFLGNRVPEGSPDLEMLPSEYFARNVYACYWFEQVAPRRLIERQGGHRPHPVRDRLPPPHVAVR